MIHEITSISENEILFTPSTISGLCKLVRKLGYKDPHQQLYNRDGSCIGDLLLFLEDNPGAIDAMTDWISKQKEFVVSDDSVEDEDLEPPTEK